MAANDPADCNHENGPTHNATALSKNLGIGTTISYERYKVTSPPI